MSASVDWQALAERLGTITWTEGGRSELGGGAVGCQALVEILGDRFFTDAVDYVVGGEPGYATAQSVLRLLRPPAAMNRCMALSESSNEVEDARAAVLLLGDICDIRALDWYPTLLRHEDHVVRTWALKIVDRLWMDGVLEYEQVAPLLQPAFHDSSDVVRSSAERIMEMVHEAMVIETRQKGLEQ